VVLGKGRAVLGLKFDRFLICGRIGFFPLTGFFPVLSQPTLSTDMPSEPPSTMKPVEVAHFMVEQAVKKHKDRYESIFMKAVGGRQASARRHPRLTLALFISSSRALCCPLEASSQRSSKRERLV